MDGGGVLMVVLFIGIAVFAFFLSFSRSESVLDEWANENGFEILESEYRTFFRGPFFFRSSKGQTVYRVKVRDRDGRVRSGWVRCGGWFLGLLSDKAVVDWDD